MSICFCTFSANAFELVKSKLDASSSCSAWLKRSAATNFSFAFSSAITRISLGPATESIETFPKSSFLASATKIFPGPTILSTFFILLVPMAIAAIA